MNKIGRPIYLSNDKESLMVSDAGIKGGHGIPLVSNSLLGKLKRVIKAVKFWCGDNYILNNVTPQVFPPSCQSC